MIKQEANITLEKIIKNSNSVSDISNISKEILNDINFIASKAFKQKGVYTVTITLLLYKHINPNQDIRYHQSKMDGGFSGRSFDTKYITPTLKKVGLPSMAESGWLTRSLEQAQPYTLDYRGKIMGGVKEPFLRILDYIQKNRNVSENCLRLLLNKVIEINEQSKVIITPLVNPDRISINNIIEALNSHFKSNYGTHGGSKLPVIAFYSIYQCLIEELDRYKDCCLGKLAKHTASDKTSKSAGDIEIFKENYVFEAIEIKLDIQIDSHITRVAIEKIQKFNTQRYYILSYYGIKKDDEEEINELINGLKINHGCQLIINGLIPTLKYYLRLINNLPDFIKNYNHNIEYDNELQQIHKDKWNELKDIYLNL